MTLQDIVAFCNQLDGIDVHADSLQTIRALESIVYVISNSKVQSQDLSQQLDNQLQQIKQDLHRFDNIVKTIKQNLDTVIAANDGRCIDLDLERYSVELQHQTVDFILNRKVSQDTDSLQRMTSRIRLLADWRVPGLIFRPNDQEWMTSMVTLDPLYIVDHDQQLLTPFMSQFNELYQRRLRPYLITDTGAGTVLHQLPDNQFGLVLAYNYFNYKPLPVLEKYFAELYHKLRPGGRVIFTYNDCEVAQNMGLNERCFMMYQPWRLLRPMLEKFGYEIHSINRDGGDMVWAEIGRPGTITSIRGAQALAKIVAI